MTVDYVRRRVEERVRQANVYIGHRMRTRRRERGLTVAMIAHAIDVRPRVINEVEAGLREIGLDQLLVIAKLLDVPPTYFYEDLKYV